MNHIVCNHCETEIPIDTDSVLTTCDCGKVSVDGNDIHTRVIADDKDYEWFGDME